MKNILSTILFTLGLGFVSLTPAQQESVGSRQADVRVTFNDSNTYKGSYTGTAVTRFCGQTDPMRSGRKTFSMEYPLDLPPGNPIEDVTFFSDEMVDGVKKSNKFYVSVNVSAPVMGHPAALVIDTSEPKDKSSGEANLAVKGNEIVLSVKATNSLGEKLDLLVTCHPPKKQIFGMNFLLTIFD